MHTVNWLNDGTYLPFICGFYLSCVIQSNARDRMINWMVLSVVAMLLTEINFLVLWAKHRIPLRINNTENYFIKPFLCGADVAVAIAAAVIAL